MPVDLVRCEPLPAAPLTRDKRGAISLGPARVCVVKDASWWVMHFAVGSEQPIHPLRRRGRKGDAMDTAEALLAAVVCGAVGPRSAELVRGLRERGVDGVDMGDLGHVLSALSRETPGATAPLPPTVRGEDSQRDPGGVGPWGCGGLDVWISRSDLARAGFPVERADDRREPATLDLRYRLGEACWVARACCSDPEAPTDGLAGLPPG